MGHIMSNTLSTFELDTVTGGVRGSQKTPKPPPTVRPEPMYAGVPISEIPNWARPVYEPRHFRVLKMALTK